MIHSFLYLLSIPVGFALLLAALDMGLHSFRTDLVDNRTNDGSK